MDEMKDIFVHAEGSEKVAYQGGKEIARMDPMGYERFVTALFQWIRQNGQRPIWLFDESGTPRPADKLLNDIHARK
jgi:hypothetical protein